jgi:putative flippase GtrA
MLTPEFVRVLLAGGIAAGANFGSRFFFSTFLDYGFAVFFAYLVGMLVAFLLMRGHVFKAKNGSLAPQVMKFIGVNVVAVLQTLVIMSAFGALVTPHDWDR